MVTAKGTGTANITVTTDNGKTATCKVTVSPKAVTSVSIKSSLSLEVGETYTLTPSVYPSDAVTSFSWSSDRSSVATVSQYGVVTAKGTGTANITVTTDNGKTATCKVTVTAQELKEYEFRYSVYDGGKVVYNGLSLAGSGTFNIEEGSDVKLTIIPDDGYRIWWIWVDWEDMDDQLVNNVLTIRNIQKDTDLTVFFEEDETGTTMNSVNLHCDISDGGYISVSGTTIRGASTFSANEGDDIKVKIIADTGFHLSSVTLNGSNIMSQLSGNELTIRNMTQDRNLVVRFEKDDDQPAEPVAIDDNALVLGNVSASTGMVVAFPVSMTNKDDITALQMDLHFPTGITLDTDEDGEVQFETSDRVTSKHTVDCNRMTDGSYRFICYSTKNATFAGNSGVLFNVILKVGAGMADGTYDITATNIELSDKTGTAYTLADAKGTITVKSYMLGDTDNNGKHTINDVVCIINHILNQPNMTFVEAAADLDGNGKITVNDAVLLISDYILSTSSNARQFTVAATDDGGNYISIEDIRMQPGEVKTIEVLMTNERNDIKGLQCDITLPTGISFLYDEDTEEYVSATWRVPRKLTLSSEKQGNNTLRVAGVCTSSSGIYGYSGAVFSFKVKADDNITAGRYQIQLSNVELSYGEAISVADRVSALEITNGLSSIVSLAADGQQPSVYDLKGHRVDVSKTKNCIYVINGRKVFVK